MRRTGSVLLILLCAIAFGNVVGAVDDIPLRYPAAQRVVAIGDVHGDLDATRRALMLAGAIDENNRWIGGDLVVVQTGDQLDRGDDEQAILDFLARLVDEARQAGGALHVLNGNHELMNVKLDLRYVTPGGYEDFEDFASGIDVDTVLTAYDESHRGRVAAFRPGGPYAEMLSRRNTIVIVGETVFVHGGILPEHIDYGLERINVELREWMAGDAQRPEWIAKKESPVWSRRYSMDVDEDACMVLDEVLERLGARRMIVGHSIQDDGIVSYCDGKVWCVDVGMATHYGGDVQVLEIKGDTIRVLSE